jgi:tetratricopeptide (TPR) repeat protein
MPIMNATSLLDSADVLFKARAYEKAREIYEQAMAAAAELNDQSTISEACAMISRSHLILGRKDEGRPWLEKARDNCSDSMPLAWSRYLGVRGRFEWQDNELEKATKTFKEMYEYCSGKQLYERAIDGAHMVAITGNNEEKIEWSLKGIKEAEAGSVYGWLGPLWNNLGANYEDMKKYPEALDAYIQARDYHQKYGDEKNKLVADWAIGHIYRLLGNMSEAEKWMQPVLPWCQKIQDAEFEGLTHRELGEIEFSKNNMNPALEHFKLAADLLRQAEMPNWDPDGYNNITAKISEIENRLAK